MRKMYFTDISRDAARDAIFSFTGMDPVSFGICAKPCEYL
jgi:hypothetical protein